MTQSQNNKIGKNWLFTLNNYKEEDRLAFLALDCRFVCVGKEVAPTTNTPHLQGFVVFHSNKRLTALKKLNSSAYWELCRGSAQSNLDYTTKEGDYETRGEMPSSRSQVGLSNKERWSQIIATAKNGTVEDEYPEEFIRYNSTLTRLYQPDLQILDSYAGFWYHGPPGTGKSLSARRDYPGAYDKLTNKWWDGYVDEDYVIIDDLDLNHKLMGSFLKRYADHYPFRAEHKGGSRLIRPKVVIVTSNYTPDQIWPDDDMLVSALKRRYKMVRFDPAFPVLKK